MPTLLRVSTIPRTCALLPLHFQLPPTKNFLADRLTLVENPRERIAVLLCIGVCTLEILLLGHERLHHMNARVKTRVIHVERV